MDERRLSSLPMRALLSVVALAFLQIYIAYLLRHVDAKRDYLAPVPSKVALDAMAFGDRGFLHRVYAMDVQNAGDTGGRIVPIRNYDFGRVVGWLEVLQQLDVRSDFAIGMADGYFGQTQDVRNVAPIVRFMMRDVATNPQKKWRWLYGAIYLARHRLRDNGLALEVARQLASYKFPGIDPWAGMTPAFILEDEGDYKGAAAVVRETVRRFGDTLSADDKKWTANYLRFLAKVDAGEIKPRRRDWDQ
jgi:hypothetical protein